MFELRAVTIERSEVRAAAARSPVVSIVKACRIVSPVNPPIDTG